MLDVYYLREKPLPIDVPAVARLVRMRDNLEAVEAVLTEFFVLQDDGWHQERCDQEIVSMREKQADSEARDEHEKNRMRRHRERRAEMFAWLRERGVVPAWDVSIKDLQRMCNEHGMTPETHLQREQEETCNAPATAIPTPTPTPTPTPILTKANALGGAAKPRLSRKCPADFVVTDAMRAWAVEHAPLVSVDLATAAFRDHTFKTSMTDWAGAWRNWLRRDQQYTAEKQRPAKPMAAPERFNEPGYYGDGPTVRML